MRGVVHGEEGEMQELFDVEEGKSSRSDMWKTYFR